MNALAQEIHEAAQEAQNLPVAIRASRALAGVTTEAALSLLADKAKEIQAITNPDGRQQCHSTRMELKAVRVNIEKAGKAAREDATAFSKAVIAEGKRLIGFIEPEESRLEGLQKEWDERIAREKAEKEAAERKRVARIQEEIDNIKNRPVIAAAWPSIKLKDELMGLEIFVPSEEVFQEFLSFAQQAHQSTTATIRELLAAAEAREAEVARLEAERAELKRLRAEQAERERIAAEAQAEADRKAREELARQQAELRRQQEELALQQAKAEAKRRAEEEAARQAREAEERAHQERLAAERREHEAKLAAERVEQERQAAEERAKQEAEAARIAAEKAELERQQREKEEAERAEREARERAEREAADLAAQQEQERKSRIERAAPLMLEALQAWKEADGVTMESHDPETVIATWEDAKDLRDRAIAAATE